jgi:2-phosphosulfolactate phosphatase
MLVASFVVVSATVRLVQSLAPGRVTFVVTGQVFDGGQEDLACAQYFEALLQDRSPDINSYIDKVCSSHDAQVFYDPSRPEFPESDMIHCTSVDRFDFAMPVTREDGTYVIRPAR